MLNISSVTGLGTWHCLLTVMKDSYSSAVSTGKPSFNDSLKCLSLYSVPVPFDLNVWELNLTLAREVLSLVEMPC